MNSDLLVISSILIIGFGIVIYLINKKQNSTQDKAMLEWMKSMQVSFDQNSKSMNSTLASNTQALNERLDRAAQVIGAVQKNIGEMSEIGRSMKDLNDFLKSPKLRGNIGEQVLKELLSQMLPKASFNMQYAFKSGSIVDAAIKTEAGIIPIDSKFPMENFRAMNESETEAEKKIAEKSFTNDVKKHIDDIAKKYILPAEGTIDYALMYVPSESVYYEIVNNSTIFDYSQKHRVLPVSPMTFYAFLRAILMGFEGQKITMHAQKILSALRSIQTEYEKVGDSLDTLNKHITNSYNMMKTAETSFSRLGDKIKNTKNLEAEEKELLQA
ncbi:MAG TPA: DNA recombination protein RmuC [Patescibacteria group bacterium]|nr:DNA recombination protein RmuC [Patescibacteria group bacterium]